MPWNKHEFEFSSSSTVNLKPLLTQALGQGLYVRDHGFPVSGLMQGGPGMKEGHHPDPADLQDLSVDLRDLAPGKPAGHGKAAQGGDNLRLEQLELPVQSFERNRPV